jgi:hypothetical protein
MIDPFEVSRHFVAKKAAGEGVVSIARQSDRPILRDGDPHGAGVGTIKRTNSPQNIQLCHRLCACA